MIKLERTKQIEPAIRRAAHNHNFITMRGANQYLVSGKSEVEYTVKFLMGADGFAWAMCNCPAGQSSEAWLNGAPLRVIDNGVTLVTNEGIAPAVNPRKGKKIKRTPLGR